MEASLLVELLTEELPPKSLVRLQDAFADEVFADLARHRLVDRESNSRAFATPRRLAVLIPNVIDKGSGSENSIEGPQAANAKAVEGFARKHKLSPEQLERRQTPKGEIVVARVKTPGVSLDSVLAELVEKALKKLPIAKVMRWGDGEAQFVRPVHGLVMLHGNRIVPGQVLGVPGGNRTRGHRFMGESEIILASADSYEAQLRDKGSVIADFAMRQKEIENQLHAQAALNNASLGDYGTLLEEVAALVEHPTVYVGSFDRSFLEVPQECLTLTMRQNQKYFPLFDGAGKLLSKFLIVSNMRAADPRHIVAGNERVVRPRLDDARFFFNQDRKERLETRVPRLAKVVYHNKLGSALERVERIQLLAGSIARKLGADAVLAERAAWLAKADLLTGMVGEFPELQGVMGRYYALHDKEPSAVAEALEGHYRPRFSGDRLPDSPISCAVALADKLDALAGLFSIGEAPTGDKDPFGLRRAALGVIRILVEKELALSLPELVSCALKPYDKQVEIPLEDFIYERFAGYLKDRGFSTLQVDAVMSKRPAQLLSVPRQLEAVKAFESLPEAESLAAANKRVANILKQASSKGERYGSTDRSQLKEPAEIALFDVLQKSAAAANRLFETGDYAGYLKAFAVLKVPVDAFFDQVMVMAEQESVRRNRLALLSDLREAMNRVADISKLAA